MEERKILKQSIAEHQAAIDRASKELANLDKPELRQGDYGYMQGVPRLFSFDYRGELRTAISKTDKHPFDISPLLEYTILGNIFDDLKRNSEDLIEFYVDGKFANIFAGRILGGRINIAGKHLLFDEAVDFHQKLGQLIATAKRREACNGHDC